MLTILANIVAFFIGGAVFEFYGPMAGLVAFLGSSLVGTAISIQIEVFILSLGTALRLIRTHIDPPPIPQDT